MKCPYCGYDKIQPNFNFCPKCKKSLKENDFADKVVEHDKDHSQEKERLIEELKALATQKITDNDWGHDTAMCYSRYIAPPQIVKVKCGNCNKIERIKDYEDDLKVIEESVAEIRRLGYQASVIRLCPECAAKQGVVPILMSHENIRTYHDLKAIGLGEIGLKAIELKFYYLFAFRLNKTSDIIYSISGDKHDFRTVAKFLRDNIVPMGQENEIAIIEYMTGLHIPREGVAFDIWKIAEERISYLERWKMHNEKAAEMRAVEREMKELDRWSRVGMTYEAITQKFDEWKAEKTKRELEVQAKCEKKLAETLDEIKKQLDRERDSAKISRNLPADNIQRMMEHMLRECLYISEMEKNAQDAEAREIEASKADKSFLGRLRELMRKSFGNNAALKKCAICGNELQADTIQCPRCGAPVIDGNAASEKKS